MPPPRASLVSFLKSAKSHLQNFQKSPSTTPLTFVIGNESADLDSLCSAVLFAYLKTYSKAGDSFYIPLSNLNRADLGLRPELRPVLSRADLSTNDLITLCDLPFSANTDEAKGLEKDKTRWFLVDHNVLTGSLGQQFGDRVVGIIDHHVDEEKHVQLTTSEEGEGRMIKPVGSCTSLIIQAFRDSWPSAQDSSEERAWDLEVATFALGPITVDTSNVQSKNKTTDTDIEAVRFLDELISRSSSNEGIFDRKAYFDEISKAKEDIGGLSLPGILKKDYKQWSEKGIQLGISSVVKNLDFLLEKAGSKEEFLQAIESFAKERELDLFSIMTTSHTSSKFTRELLLYARNSSGVKAAEKFEKDAGDKLGLRVWNEGSLDSGKGWRKCWVQEKTENSRKQVAPLLRDAML